MKSTPRFRCLSFFLIQCSIASDSFVLSIDGHSRGSITRTRLVLASKSPHEQAIDEALEASKKFGATSPEARVAWEIAEEIENSIFSPCSKRCDPIPFQKESGDDSSCADSYKMLSDGDEN
eukprot:scaffold4805_cov136-Cylindrotheca_fusiformis.AAC.11